MIINKIKFSIPDRKIFGKLAGMTWGINIAPIPPLETGTEIGGIKENTVAQLHKGETVLNAKDSEVLANAVNGGDQSSKDLLDKLDTLTDAISSMRIELDGQKVVVLRSAGDAGQLYGSVNNRDISAAAVEHGFKIDRRQITLTRPVKTLGLHPIRVRLHAEVFATIIINVARTDEEAKRQSALGRAIIENEPEEIEEQVIDNSELFEEGAIPTSSMSDEDKAEIEVEIENKE